PAAHLQRHRRIGARPEHRRPRPGRAHRWVRQRPLLPGPADHPGPGRQPPRACHRPPVGRRSALQRRATRPHPRRDHRRRRRRRVHQRLRRRDVPPGGGAHPRAARHRPRPGRRPQPHARAVLQRRALGLPPPRLGQRHRRGPDHHGLRRRPLLPDPHGHPRPDGHVRGQRLRPL
ncbi:MAG: Sporulation-specific_N-acetylmuramoyl-L-alanine_amidase, partial [uncultured Acidimicrobiales bacterium]